MYTRNKAKQKEYNKLVSGPPDVKIYDPLLLKDPNSIQDSESPSMLIFELEHSIKIWESMELSTILMPIQFISKKIGNTIISLQSSLLATSTSKIEKMINRLPYRIWNFASN